MITLGTTDQGAPLQLDLDKLVAGRGYVEANSGGGKSHTLRVLIEQTHGQIQQFVIDVEDEFYTLRERGEFLLVGGDNGDCPANPATAGLLARRLLETGASAILSLFHLSVGDPDEPETNERALFVRNFLNSMMTAPRELWHPVMVVIDEAHVFAPEGRASVSKRAVIDLMSQGRKRPFCGVLATQRPTKISKDAIAEANNVLIGRAARPLDIKEAAKELGFDSQEARVLKFLEPGEFFALGPAFVNQRGIARARIRDVLTTHLRPGKVAPPTPPAQGRIREMLAELADLQVEAKKEISDLEAARARIADLEQRMSAGATAVSRVEYREIEKIVEKVVEVPTPVLSAEMRQMIRRTISRLREISDDAQEAADIELDHEGGSNADAGEKPAAGVVVAPAVQVQTSAPSPAERAKSSAPAAVKDTSGLERGAREMLVAIAMFFPGVVTRSQVGTLTGIKSTGSTFRTYLSAIRTRGFIEDRGDGLRLTETGIAHLGPAMPKRPKTMTEIIHLWEPRLERGARLMLYELVDKRGAWISRDALSKAVSIDASGSTFRTYLSALRANGLADVSGNLVRASSSLFPEKAA